METAESQLKEFRQALLMRAERYAVELDPIEIGRLCDYYELLLAWNERLHLVSPCSPAEFATRHVLESLLLLSYLKPGGRLADIGSGAGLPIIPNLVARPDIQATLIEASKKKSVFLTEALRQTGTIEQATVVAERFEDVLPPRADYVTCRALDRFGEMFSLLVEWSPPESTLLFFGSRELGKKIEDSHLKHSRVHIPDSQRRFLYLIARR